jgi:uncharacterized protein (TIGR02646 family)
MIYIDRNRIARPKELDALGEKALEKLKEFYKRKKRIKMQRRPPFDSQIWLGTRDALQKLFHSKCAYCECQLINVGEVDVDHYRPKSNAMSIDKRVSPEHYWWLAYTWENLYPTCKQCNRQKASRFPVKGPRVPIGTTGGKLHKENRLLLDPCYDKPDQFLRFNEDGTVSGKGNIGKTSIEVFGLNRKPLVESRRKEISSLRSLLMNLAELSKVPAGAQNKKEKRSVLNISSQLMDALLDTSPFSGAKRQVISRLTADLIPKAQLEASKIKTVLSYLESDKDEEKLDQVTSDTLPRVEAGSIWIERIEIKNFKVINDIEISFSEPSSEQDPWIVLLGENGVGKSSVLKAIAMVFMDHKNRKRFVSDASTCVNLNARPRKGYVKVHFNHMDKPVELHFHGDSPDFETVGDLPPVPLLAYGSTRLPPPPDSIISREPMLVRVGNLFDPHEPLSDAEPWLADIDRVDSDTFGLLARSLRDLLSLNEADQISRRAGRLRINIQGKPINLREHSDGYQSVIALATDIMLNLAKDWSTMESAEGTVLLDEIECHLHPKWKIEIISRLRTMFPHVRFIVTTHDPLCLHGTREKEIYRLFLNKENRKISSTPLDLPPGLRSDQVLTGSWFELSTTLDKETIALFQEHSLLLAKGARANNNRRVELEKILSERFGGFGETAIERLAIGVAAEIMDREHKELNSEDRINLKKEIMQRLEAKRAKKR